jgi:DNA-directed RNA polymerase specialized sigma24 family protein
MSSDASVSFWISQLKVGDEKAAQKIWEGYFARLVDLARGKLRGTQRRIADEEDVALSAFDSFCRGAQRNRFPKLEDRDDLWQLLLMITARKAIDLRQYETRQRRGGGRENLDQGRPLDYDLLNEIVGREPTPEFAAQVADQCRRLLDRLEVTELRQLALWKMEGFTNAEIAERLGVVSRTIERKLRLIRDLFQSMGDGFE